MSRTSIRAIDFPFRFAPIIHRNTPLPASRSDIFTTVYDARMRSRSRSTRAKATTSATTHRIGNFRIEGLAKVPAGNQLVVQLDLNLDGMLKVSARERATGLQKQVTIENALAKFEREERSESMERLQQLVEPGRR